MGPSLTTWRFIMSRRICIFGLVLALTVALLPMLAPPTYASPSKPTTKNDGSCSRNAICMHLTRAHAQGNVAPDLQSGNWSCTFTVFPTTVNNFPNVIGHAGTVCDPWSGTVYMKTCVQVSRWYGWQTLSPCSEVTLSPSTGLDQWPHVTPLSGTYTYRTWATATVTINGASDSGTLASGTNTYTF